MPDLSLHYCEPLPEGLHISHSCPPLALLRASLEEVLPAEIAADVSGHIDTCTLCQILLTDLEAVPSASLTSAKRKLLRRQLSIAPPASKPGWYWYVASASAMALVVAGIALFLHRPDSGISPDRMTPSQPAAAPPTAAGAQPPEPQPRIPKLAPPLDLSPPLVLRGEVSYAQPTAQQFAPAFAAYTQSNYPLAAQRLRILADQYPRSETPFLYLGITQLLQHENQPALRNLARADSLACQNNGTQRNDAAWYHALAAIAAQSTDAPDLLESICSHKQSPYSEQACELRASRK